MVYATTLSIDSITRKPNHGPRRLQFKVHAGNLIKENVQIIIKELNNSRLGEVEVRLKKSRVSLLFLQKKLISKKAFTESMKPLTYFI